jgi:protein phosphatase
VDPRWLIYLPPTMSPSETAKDGGLLEHPREAFAYFRQNGVGRVVCEEKHMGSRAVLVVCRDEAARRRRFRLDEGPLGVCTTRTGRPFFSDEARSRELIDRVRAAMDRADLWAELRTDWVCLDAELLPWSAKAQDLLRGQYAAVGSSGRASLDAAVRALTMTAARDESARELLDRHAARKAAMDGYVAAYRRYCWPVRSLADIRLAPFHLLASEGAVHAARDHGFHLRQLARLAEVDPAFFVETPHRVVDLSDPQSEAQAVAFWTEMVERGGEGMVVKSWEWVVRGPRGLVQPAIKCRGPEYLRIIYGPEYLTPQHLARLRHRSVSGKRALALREYALGLEALHRFVEGEPLHRVHECVFGVLALESEPVDPRL